MRFLKGFFKIFAWIIGIILLLLILLVLLLRIPSVQNKALQAAIPTIESILGGAEVEIGQIDLDFFDAASVQEILIRDLKGDTLLYAQELGLDIGAFSLMGAELFVDEIRLEGAVINAYQLKQDSAFNYQFIIDAFAPTTPVPVDTSAASFAFGLRTVNLQQTRIRLLDQKAATDLKVSLGAFVVDVASLDLDNLAVDLANVEVADVKGSYILGEVVGDDQSPTSTVTRTAIAFPYAGLPVTVSQLSLKQIDFAYRDDNLPRAQMGLDPGNISIENLSAQASEFRWDSTSIALNWEALSFDEQSGLEIDELSFGLALTPQHFDLNNFTFKTSESAVLVKAELNYNTFERLVNLDPSTEVDVSFRNSFISFHELQLLAPALESAGLNLNTTANIFVDGSVSGSLQKLMLDALNVRIGKQTSLIASGSVSNPLDPDNLQYDLTVSKLTSSYNDLKRLTKGIELPVGLADFGAFRFSGSLTGSTTSLNGKKLNLITGGRTAFSGDLKLTNLDDLDNLLVDAKVTSLKTNSAEIKSFIPDSLAVNVESLGNIDFNGNYKGSLTDFALDGQLDTDLGSLKADLAASLNSDYTDGSYKGQLGLNEFDLGTFLRDTTLGTLSLDLELDGEGLSPERIASNLEGKIGEFTYLGYTYHDVKFNGQLNEQKFEGFLKIDDPNVRLIFNGLVDFRDTIPVMVFEADLDTVALQPLNLYPEPLGLSASISSNITGNSADNLSGRLAIDSILMQNGERTAHLNQLLLRAGDTTVGRFLKITSDVLNAQLLGKYSVAMLPDVLVAYVDNFFPVMEYTSSPGPSNDTQATTPQLNRVHKTQDFEFNFELRDPVAIVNLFDEGLTELDTAYFVGYFNSSDKLNAKFYLPGVAYAGTTADTILASITGDEDDLTLDTHTTELLIAGTSIFNLNAKVNLGRDSLVFGFEALADADSTILATRLAVTENVEGRYLASFINDLSIIGQTWEIDPANRLEYWNNYLDINNLNFSKDDQRILVSSDDESLDDDIAPITVLIENFKLSEFEGFVLIDSFSLTGLANGKIAVQDPYGELYYTADLTANDIVMNGEPVGDFTANASSTGLDQLVAIDIRLDGNINDAAIAGTYDIQTGDIDLDARIRAIELRLIDPLAVGVLSNTTGVLMTDLKVTGNIDEPAVNGFVALDKAATTVDLLGTRFKVADSRIDLSERLLDFNTFVIADSTGRKATITGTIAHDYFENFQFNLRFQTDGFKVLGTQPSLTDLYYGTAIVSADLAISGDLDIPVVRGAAATKPGTDLTIVPLISVNGVSQEDWVIYADPETLVQDTLVDLNDLYKANTLGIDMAVVVTVQKEATLNVLIDPSTGDALLAHGDAELNINMTPDGDISVTGLYEIDRGAYQFTLPTLGVKLRQYNFEIKKGSYMRFVGDPLDSRFDITAIYSSETTTYELLQLEASGSIDDSQAASAKRRQEVNVLMEMKGTIDDPDLKLAIDVPQAGGSVVTNDVQRILNSLSEQATYEQVFSLLVFNSFNAFGGGGGGGSSPGEQGAQIAINSLSNLVSNQLNKLANKALGGFDVNIGLDSYKDRYTGSRQNTANLDLSRSLLDDRLTITLGTDVNVGSNELVAGDNAAGFQSNFVLRYQLIEDGRFFVSVFRRPDYDVISTATPYENGVGVSYSKKFN